MELYIPSTVVSIIDRSQYYFDMFCKIAALRNVRLFLAAALVKVSTKYQKGSKTEPLGILSDQLPEESPSIPPKSVRNRLESCHLPDQI